MDFFQVVEKSLVQRIVLCMLGGLTAGFLRALFKKDPPKPFFVRMIAGSITAAFGGAIFYDFALPRAATIAIVFACGWASLDIGTLLSNLGVEIAKGVFGIDKKEKDGTDTES